MNFKLVINDYILIWNILFQASISKEVQDLKQKLWKNYKKAYNALYKEKDVILKDYKDYIPTDDTIFDMVKSTETYQFVKSRTEKYRLGFMKYLEEKKKDLNKELKSILRFDLNPCYVLFIEPHFNYIEVKKTSEKSKYVMIWGREKNQDNIVLSFVDLLHVLLEKELENYQKEYRDIVQAIIELAIDNELATRLLAKSVYLRGKHSLSFLKAQIYPYWLMYLGYKKDEIVNCMKRDRILFDLDKYTYEKGLVKLNLLQFIDFCIKHRKAILKINELEMI